MSKICPNCQTEFDDSHGFCSNCGSRLVDNYGSSDISSDKVNIK